MMLDEIGRAAKSSRSHFGVAAATNSPQSVLYDEWGGGKVGGARW